MLGQRSDEAAPAASGADGSTAGKAFAVLEALGAHGPIGISALSQRLGMSKTTVHRFLQTLKTLGFVAQEDETERYRLTIDADYGLRMHSRIGRTNPPYSTAIGKVLLAWMAPRRRARCSRA